MKNLKYSDGSATYVESLEKKIAELKKEIVAIEKNTDYWADKANWIKNNEPVAWFEQDPDMKSIWYQADQDSPNAIPLYTHPVKELTDRIAELENQLGFIASINRAGLGVVTATPMPSEKIEKIWNAIEEQKDDNFHYGWKKCEQYYGFAHPVKEQLTDEEIIEFIESWEGLVVTKRTLEMFRAILRKAQEK